MTNLLDNGDFSDVQGNCPLDWKSFGYCEVYLAEEKYKDKNVCRTGDRMYTYSGMAQNLTYTISLGEY